MSPSRWFRRSMASWLKALRPQPAREATHEKRFRASLAWALTEYADTLAKLAK